MKHPVGWFEVLGKDAGKLCQFYSALFGWSFGGDPSAYQEHTLGSEAQGA